MTAPLAPLAQIVAGAPDDQEPAPDFRAQLDGVEYVVTAVLERTAVLEVPGDRRADKQMAQLERLLVDPTAIAWLPHACAGAYGAVIDGSTLDAIARIVWYGAICG